MNITREIVVIHKYEAIKAVLDEFCNVLPSLSRGAEYRLNMEKKFSENGNFIICRDNHEIVGFAAFYCNDKNNHTGYLSMIAVLQKSRNTGIGHQMLSYVEEYCLSNNMKKIVLETGSTNDIALGFYKKNGYITVGSASQTTIFMQKEI